MTWYKSWLRIHTTCIYIISFPASGNSCCLLIIFANSLDPDQAQQTVRHSWKIFLKKKANSKKKKKKIHRPPKSMQNYPACKELRTLTSKPSCLSTKDCSSSRSLSACKYTNLLYNYNIATDKAFFSSEKCWYLSYFSTKTYVVGTH